MTGNCSLQFSLHFRSNNLTNGSSENYKNDKTGLLLKKTTVGQCNQIFYFRRRSELLKILMYAPHAFAESSPIQSHDDLIYVLMVFREEWQHERHFKRVKMQTDFCSIIHDYCARLRHCLPRRRGVTQKYKDLFSSPIVARKWVLFL